MQADSAPLGGLSCLACFSFLLPPFLPPSSDLFVAGLRVWLCAVHQGVNSEYLGGSSRGQGGAGDTDVEVINCLDTEADKCCASGKCELLGAQMRKQLHVRKGVSHGENSTRDPEAGEELSREGGG